jgi:hypothetical protein
MQKLLFLFFFCQFSRRTTAQQQLNISYNGIHNSLSIINGLDKDHLIKDVTLENLRINGKLINSVEEGNIKVGEFAKNIMFKNSQPAKKNLSNASN